MSRKPTAKESVGYIASASTVSELVDWGAQPDCIEGESHSSGLLLYKSTDEAVESGLWVCTPGRWKVSIPGDELCHFVQGRCTYRHDNGTVTEVSKGSVVFFPAGWSGECTVHETIRNTYMIVSTPPAADVVADAKVLQDPTSLASVADWGAVPTLIEGSSHTSGVMLYRRPDRSSEPGVWMCTPGYWNCHVTSDEYCHFIEGYCTYVHESGEVIEITPDTLAFFPKDWKGTCRITETVRKIYMIR